MDPVLRSANAPIDVGLAIRNAMTLLYEAFSYARDVGLSRWDFAVEMRCLRDAGVTRSDLRWLVCKGYVDHADEVTLRRTQGRNFRMNGRLTLSDNTCFVLTDEGLAFCKAIGITPQMVLPFRQASAPIASPTESGLAPDVESPARQVERPAPQPGRKPERRERRVAEAPMSLLDQDSLRPEPRVNHATPPHVVWDAERRELTVNGEVVKRFRCPAPSQELILSVFQEEGWPVRIDDPLPPRAGVEPKQRLHAAINCLNRNQQSQLIRFGGDGNGTGICWEFVK